MAETFKVGDVVAAVFPSGHQYDKINVLGIGKSSSGKVYYEVSTTDRNGTWLEEDRCFKIIERAQPEFGLAGLPPAMAERWAERQAKNSASDDDTSAKRVIRADL